MSAVLAPPAAPPSASSAAPGPSDAAAFPTARRFVAGYVGTLLVPVLALAALLAGWTATHATGWPPALAAVAGWSLAVVGWLRSRRWPAGTAHLVTWAAPVALLGPLAGLGLLSADQLILWGPGCAVLALALAAVRDPDLLCRPARSRSGPAVSCGLVAGHRGDAHRAT
jgi:hypothetical protein